MPEISSVASYRNDTGKDVPPFGLVRSGGVEVVDGEEVVIGLEPDGTTTKPHFINNLSVCKEGKFGEVYRASGLFPLLCDTGLETVGPKETGGFIAGPGSEFKVVGQVSGSLHLVIRLGGAGLIDIKMPTAGIPARAVDQYGNAVCEVVVLDSAGKASLNGRVETVWNFSTENISANGTGLGQAMRGVDGLVRIISFDCSLSGNRNDVQ
jgi:hypothetical protein